MADAPPALRIDYGGAATRGKRSYQEDEWGSQDGDGELLLMLADGMGGGPAGETASNLAIRSFMDAVDASRVADQTQRLYGALLAANQELAREIETDPDKRGMGTTFIAVHVADDWVNWLSVGDSSLLRWREGRLKRLNVLHTYERQLRQEVADGHLSEAEAAERGKSGGITSAVMGDPIEEIDQGRMRLESGDVLILASDGLETIADDEIRDLVTDIPRDSAQPIANVLVDRVVEIDRTHQDNTTVVALLAAFDHGDDEAVSSESIVLRRGLNWPRFLASIAIMASVLFALILLVAFLLGGSDEPADTGGVVTEAPPSGDTADADTPAPVPDSAPETDGATPTGEAEAPAGPDARPAPAGPGAASPDADAEAADPASEAGGGASPAPTPQPAADAAPGGIEESSELDEDLRANEDGASGAPDAADAGEEGPKPDQPDAPSAEETEAALAAKRPEG